VGRPEQFSTAALPPCDCLVWWSSSAHCWCQSAWLCDFVRTEPSTERQKTKTDSQQACFFSVCLRFEVVVNSRVACTQPRAAGVAPGVAAHPCSLSSVLLAIDLKYRRNAPLAIGAAGEAVECNTNSSDEKL
jgi:hypothetical protein